MVLKYTSKTKLESETLNPNFHLEDFIYLFTRKILKDPSWNYLSRCKRETPDFFIQVCKSLEDVKPKVKYSVYVTEAGSEISIQF